MIRQTLTAAMLMFGTACLAVAAVEPVGPDQCR